MIVDLWLTVIARLLGWWMNGIPAVPTDWFVALGGVSADITSLMAGTGPLMFLFPAGSLDSALTIVATGFSVGLVIRVVRLIVNVLTTAGVPVDS